MSTTTAASYLAEPLLTSPGQPLRIAVYSRLAHGIRSGTFDAGALLPRETELGASLGVSRTVVREALMLLEEDGLIVTKRGVGRFVAQALPHEGVLSSRPLENLLDEPGTTLKITVVEFGTQDATDFVSEQLGLADDARFWFRESIATRDGLPVALIQEYLPVETALDAVDPRLSPRLQDAAARPATLLQSFTAELGDVFDAGSFRIAANVAGRTRAAQLAIKATDPLLVLTHTALVKGTPVYVTKCALPPAFGHLAISQRDAHYPA